MALRAVVNRVNTRLRAIARRLGHSREEGEDLCQEALVKVTSPGVLARYQGRGALDAYLLSVGVRAMLTVVRARGARDWRRTEFLNGRAPASTNESVTTPVPDDLDPALRDALLALPARARLIVVVIALADYSYADAAALTGLPVGTVKSAYSRARQALRGALEAQPVGSGLRS